MNSEYFWWFLDIYRTTQVANRLHTWNAVPFVAFESIKQISTRSCPQSVMSACLSVQNVFDFWPLPGHTYQAHHGEGGVGVGVCQKSVFHARAHFCQDIIPWDLFVYAIFCVASPLPLVAVIFHFDFLYLPPSSLPHLAHSQLFFIVANPEASRLVNCVQRGAAYACVGSLGPQITSFWIIMENIKWMSRPFIFITKLCSLHQIYYTQLEHFARFVRY